MNFQPLSLFISTTMVIHIFIRSSKYDSFHVFIQYLNVVMWFQPYFLLLTIRRFILDIYVIVETGEKVFCLKTHIKTIKACATLFS